MRIARIRAGLADRRQWNCGSSQQWTIRRCARPRPRIVAWNIDDLAQRIPVRHVSALIADVVDLHLPSVGQLMLNARGPLQHIRRRKLLRIHDVLTARAKGLARWRVERLWVGIAGCGAAHPRIREVDRSARRGVGCQCGERSILRRLGGGEEVGLVIHQAAPARNTVFPSPTGSNVAPSRGVNCQM